MPSTPSPATAVFLREGEAFVPTDAARGPWYPDTQHGSPMLALLARAAERHPAERPMQVTRLTVDLFRAAPMAPVTTRTRMLRRGRSIEWIEASLVAEDRECARATAMRFRVSEIDVPLDPDGAALGEAPPLEVPDDERLLEWISQARRGNAFENVVEIRPVRGFETPTAWLRLRLPLVEGEATTPLERTAFLADMTYSVPLLRRIHVDRRSLLERPFVAINPDTSVNLHRMPEGEWLCLDARVSYALEGAGTAVARLYDPRGPVGAVTQALFVRGADAAPAEWKRYELPRESLPSGEPDDEAPGGQAPQRSRRPTRRSS